MIHEYKVKIKTFSFTTMSKDQEGFIFIWNMKKNDHKTFKVRWKVSKLNNLKEPFCTIYKNHFKN